jgi:ABC-type ATPase involved in cell division
LTNDTTKLQPVAGRQNMNLGKDIITNDDITLSPEAILRHLYIIGKSGTGKSTFIENIVLELAEAGFGLAFFDPHTTSVRNIADRLPVNRTQDTIFWKPFDTSHVWWLSGF